MNYKGGDPLGPPWVAVLALGGGYGHACRAAAALHTLHPGVSADVLVSDPDLPPALLAGHRAYTPPQELRADPAALGAWISAWLQGRDPDLVWVDAFPAGVLGELDATMAPGARWELLARHLLWERYALRLPADPPWFDRVWLTEDVDPAELAWLREQGGELTRLALIDPPLAAPEVELLTGCVLVIHSGPHDEVTTLVADAAGLGGPVVVIAPRPPKVLPPGVTAWHHLAPAAPLADRPEVRAVVTAGGASSLRQYAHLGPRHLVRPLPRPLDDQRLRAEMRNIGAA